MQDFQRNFFNLAVACEALRFGEFTLKSGRQSPYFFNAGQFHSGHSLRDLGRCYAAAINASGVEFDMLFGPSYKGIPLAASTAIAFADWHARDLPYAFNRKEAKDHGEGGVIVGAPLAGRVLILDDVISAGTSARESVELIRSAGAEVAGLAIALDRAERGQSERSAASEVQSATGAPVISIASLDDLVSYLAEKPGFETVFQQVEAYRTQYGVGS
ncbi:MAG: orotate phosphoribosyltransferase [Xanthomonadales bacterium]|nr:orotate phosphoribosyltransferase [Xanthomonadales bacterium]